MNKTTTEDSSPDGQKKEIKELIFNKNLILHSEKDRPFLWIYKDGTYELEMEGYIIISPNNPFYEKVMELINEEPQEPQRKGNK